MNKILLTLSTVLLSFSALAQDHNCGSDHVHRQKMATNAVYAERMNAFEERLQQMPADQDYTARRDGNTVPVYVIPVVVHIMHKGEPVGQGTNLSDEAIRSKIKAINQDYRNAAQHQGGADTGIEFALAVRNPQGQCTTGITRTNMSSNASYMANGVMHNTNLGFSDTSLKALDFWDSNKYYNIWLVFEIDGLETGGTAGYAYLAGSHGMSFDGAIIRSGSFLSPDDNTATHELGHALNLFHTFEGDMNGTACPPVNGCGNDQGDCVQDTAAHIRGEDCLSTSVNGCYPTNANMGYLFNHMNYTGCAEIFTNGQRSRMVSALTGIRASLLSQNGNNSLVPVSAPVAGFEIGGSVLCSGTPIQLLNVSSCVPNTFMEEASWPGTSFSWIVTNGTNTYTYTTQNPVISLPVAGSYTISLTVTTPQGSDSHTINDALFITSSPVNACIPTSVNVGSSNYSVNNVSFNNIDNATSVSTNTPYEDFSCTNSTIVEAGETYVFSVTVRANANNPEAFEAYIDYNNNGTFEVNEKIIEGSNPNGTLNTYTANVSIPETAVQNTLLRMRVIGEAGTITAAERNCTSPYFIGDVEDYGVYIVGELGSEQFSMNNLVVSPNPATSMFTISNTTVIEEVKLYNMLGQLVLSKTINDTDATIDVSSLTSGTYFIMASSGEAILKSKIIKN